MNERSKADLTVKEYISYTNFSKGTAFLLQDLISND